MDANESKKNGIKNMRLDTNLLPPSVLNKLCLLKSAYLTPLLLALCFLPQLALAVGGVVSDGSNPYFSDAGNREDFEDMRVKVLGGYVVMNRRWNGEKWTWNYRWNDLTLGNGETFEEYYERKSTTGTDNSNGGGGEGTDYSLYWLLRNDFALRRTTPTSQTWENQSRFTLTSDDDYDSFQWSDRQGNAIAYDKFGRIQGYSDRNGVKVTINRNANHNISTVEDHHGNVVITYGWETLPGEGETPESYRLTTLTDYSGRQVTYHYDNDSSSDSFGLITHLTDVRGKEWHYQYNNRQLVAQIDPDNRQTQYAIDGKGKLTSRFNADGVGMSFQHSYDSGEEEYYLSKIDGSGRVEETWSNAQGSVVRSAIDGELQFTSTFILSNNSSGVDDLIKNYQPRITGAESSSGGGRVEGTAPQFEAVYVKSETRTDARGNKTLTTFDQFRNRLKVLYADGSSVNTQWHPSFSYPTHVIDERGVITTYEYDSSANLIRMVEAKATSAERITEYQYDSAGQRKSVTSQADSNTGIALWQYEYDNYGNMTKVIDPLLNETHYSDFDVLGNARNLRDGNSLGANGGAGDSNRWLKSFEPR